MNASFRILPCSWKHHAVLAELGGTTFLEAFGAFHSAADMQAYVNKTYNLIQVRSNLENPAIHYRIAYGFQEDLGYIKLLRDVQVENLSGRVMELEKIYVRQAAHGTGVGQLLMDEAIRISREEGYEILFLGVWQENARALAFYKKNGFEIFGTRTFQLGQTRCEDFLLRLKL